MLAANIAPKSEAANKQPAFTHYAGVTATQGTTATAADLPFLFDTARPTTTAALGALIRADRAGYDSAKRTLPMLAAARFDGPRAAVNVTAFATCFVEFDQLTAPVARLWPDLLPALPEIDGLLAAFATGRGIRFMFTVPEVEGHAAPLTRELYKQVWQHVADLLAARWPELGPPDISSAKPEQLQAAWNRPDLLPYLNPTAPALRFDFDADTACEGLSKPLQSTQNDGTDAYAALTFEAYSKAVAHADGWPVAETHEGWLGFVAAAARTFGPIAEDLTAALCRRASGYDSDRHERATRRYFRHVLTAPAPAGRLAGAGTLIYAARLAGCTPPRTERAKPINETTAKVNQHVTEALPELAALIEGHEGLTLLHAPTGTGKTRAAAEWLKAREYAAAEVGVLILPYAEAARKAAAREGLPVAVEGVTAAELAEEWEAGRRVFATTFDSLAKLTREGMVIKYAAVDEAHGLPNACTFRPAARQIVPLLADVQARSGRALLLTATPPPELLLALRADVADVLTVHVQADADRTRRLIFEANGNRAELVNYVCSQVGQSRRLLLHVDRIADPLTGRGVYDLAAQLRRRGLTVATATAERPDGIAEFQAGRAAVLIGTRIVCESFDVPADGCECVAVSVCTKGIEAELLAQAGGRFRNAESVRYVAWAWGNGAYLTDRSKRESAPEGCPRFDVLASFNAARRKADRIRAGAEARTWSKLATLNAPRARGIEERADRAELDPLAVAAEAMADRAASGGMAAALPLLLDWLPNAEYAGRLIFDDEDREDLPATRFETFSKAATAALRHVKAADFVAVLLAIATADASNREANEAARKFAERYTLTAPTCPLTALRVALTDVAKAAERRARKAESEAVSKKAARKAEDRAARWAEFVALLADREACTEMLAQWAEGWAGAADRLWAWLLTLPREATKADVTRIVADLLADGLSQAKVSTARTRYAVLYALTAGIGADIPAQVVADLPRAEFLKAARLIHAALPALLADRTPRTAKEWATRIRELTGCTLGGNQAMTILRALADVETATVATPDGKRTTALLLARAVAWTDLGLSFGPREVVEAHLLNAAAKAEREGVPEDRIFRLTKAQKMHGPPPCPEPIRAAAAKAEPPDKWAWLGGPPPDLCPF